MKGIGDLFRQAQDLQAQLQRVQEEAATRTVEAVAGGGMVKATVNGRLELVALHIEPSLLSGGAVDVDMVQDLVIAAVNQAVRQAQQQMADEMGKLTGGLKLPGMG